MSDTDRIERAVVLRAPRTKVWNALTDATQFGTWFGVALEGPFVAGQPVTGQITIPGYTHVRFAFEVERIEPEAYFAYRWHPHAVDPTVDYAAEPTTLVEFRLEDDAGGTRLTVVESGFDRVPAGRRAEAFRMNTQGWEGQLRNIERHVAQRS